MEIKSLIIGGAAVVPFPVQEEGIYSVEKVPLGPAKIMVDTSSLRPKDKKFLSGRYAKPRPGTAPFPGMQGDPKRHMAIPQQYADPQNRGCPWRSKAGRKRIIST